MSMGLLLDQIIWAASASGRAKATANALHCAANELEREGHETAARWKRNEADKEDAEGDRLRERARELKQQAWDCYERFGGPTNVRVIDDRTGDHDRHEIKEAAE